MRKVSLARRKRLMLVIGSLQIGGTERHVCEIAPALINHGYRVSVFSLSPDVPLAADLTARGVEVILPTAAARRLRQWGLLGRVAAVAISGVQLVVTLFRRRPALVQCFLPAGNIAGAFAARLSGVPILISSRRSLNLYQRNAPLFARIERMSYNWADAIVANSQVAGRELTDVEGVPASRVRILFNGLDLATLRSPLGRDEARRQLDVAGGSLVFLIAANLKAYKAHTVLIEALRRTASQLPDWVLLVAGRDDGEGAAIAGEAAAAGFADRLRLLGPRHDVPVLLQAADVGVLASREEGFPNAIIEYMAAGLPVVTTAAGGAVEAVLDGVTGFVVPVDDAAAMGDRLAELANDRELRLRMGQAGRTRAENLFSLKTCVDSYIALYKELGVDG
jgi:glycosyltransferase involved in cell wall biosynthesis